MIKKGHFALVFRCSLVFVLLIQRHKGNVDQLSDFPGINQRLRRLL
jgi:hypothetical protein